MFSWSEKRLTILINKDTLPVTWWWGSQENIKHCWCRSHMPWIESWICAPLWVISWLHPLSPPMFNSNFVIHCRIVVDGLTILQRNRLPLLYCCHIDFTSISILIPMPGAIVIVLIVIIFFVTTKTVCFHISFAKCSMNITTKRKKRLTSEALKQCKLQNSFICYTFTKVIQARMVKISSFDVSIILFSFLVRVSISHCTMIQINQGWWI